jgi:ribosomal protein L33
MITLVWHLKCQECGGEPKDLPCAECGGRGYFQMDAANHPPRNPQTPIYLEEIE